MKYERQKKSLCFLLMICMLFLGMCIENVQADSFFSYESSTHTASTILSADRTTLTNQVYPVETLVKQDCITNTIQVVRRSYNRANRNIAQILAFVDILPQISPIILTSSDCELTNESSSCAVIVSYIHHKDGQKA